MFLRMFVRTFLFAVLAIGTLSAAPLEVWIMPNGANPQGMLEQRLALFEKKPA